jgi:hypothetical protein
VASGSFQESATTKVASGDSLNVARKHVPPYIKSGKFFTDSFSFFFVPILTENR